MLCCEMALRRVADPVPAWMRVTAVLVHVADSVDCYESNARLAQTCRRACIVLKTWSHVTAQARRFVEKILPSVEDGRTSLCSDAGVLPFVPREPLLDWLCASRVSLAWLLARPQRAGRWYGWVLARALEQHNTRVAAFTSDAMLEQVAYARRQHAVQAYLKAPLAEQEPVSVPYDAAHLRVPWRRVLQAAYMHASDVLLERVLYLHECDLGSSTCDLDTLAAEEMLSISSYEPLSADEWREVDLDAALLRVVRHPDVPRTTVQRCAQKVSAPGLADAVVAARSAQRADLEMTLAGLALQHARDATL